jgi:glycosyltransferase involved in cell wall biosynthesis
MIDLLVISTASVVSINRNLYVEMASQGWVVEMIVPIRYVLSDGKEIEGQQKRPIDPVIHFLKLSGSNPRLFHFPDIGFVLEQRKPKIILIESDPVSLMAVRLGRLCKKEGIPLLCLSCENLPFDILPTLKRRGLTSLFPSIMKKYFHINAKKYVDTVFTISDDGTDIFKSKGYNHVTKTPLGFDPAVFFKNEEQRIKIRTKLEVKYQVIAFFGRLVEEKGVHILIKALSKISHLDWHFMIDRFSDVKSPYYHTIEELITSLNLSSRIIFIDADHFEIANYMNAADIVVIPSLSASNWKEQYGRVAPESMACGKLVIASNTGALPELIGDCGIKVEEGNVDQLASVLSNSLTAPMGYKNLADRAMVRAQSLFSIHTQAEIYSTRMRQLLTKN